MIEIMCRDGSVSDGSLCKIALALEKMTKVEVNPLTSYEAKALVYWGVDDVINLVENIEDSVGIEVDEQDCEDILKYAEVSLYEAQLNAGWDCLWDAVSKFYGEDPPGEEDETDPEEPDEEDSDEEDPDPEEPK